MSNPDKKSNIGFAPNAPSDGRDMGDWKTRYPKKAKVSILLESIYLGFIIFSIPIILFILYNANIWELEFSPVFKKYAYAWLGGTFGGVLFDIKWLYHSVAKNLWNEDRLIWRLFTPHISGGLAFALVILISSELINIFELSALDKPSTVFGIGFLTGYFSDAAIGKLTEVAQTFFGVNDKKS